MVIATRSREMRAVGRKKAFGGSFRQWHQCGMRILLALALILPSAAAAADKPVISAADLNPPDELVRAMDGAFAMLMTPGEPEPDWQGKGIDMLERMRKAPGGIDGAIAAHDSEGDRSVRYFGSAAVPVPESFTEILSLPGVPMQGEIAFQDISELEAGVWLRSSGRLYRRGNALCGKGWETMVVLAKRDAPLSEDAQFAVMAMRLIMAKFRDIETCAVTIEQADGNLIDRAYLPDGRTLPALDREAKPVRLRPFSDAAAIILP